MSSRFGGLGLAAGLQGLPTSLKYGASMMVPVTDEEGKTTYQMPNIMALGAIGGRSSSLLVVNSNQAERGVKQRELHHTYLRLLSPTHF